MIFVTATEKAYFHVKIKNYLYLIEYKYTILKGEWVFTGLTQKIWFFFFLNDLCLRFFLNIYIIKSCVTSDIIPTFKHGTQYFSFTRKD